MEQSQFLSIVRLVLIGIAATAAVVVALLIGGALALEHGVIRPLTQRLPTEARKELAFVGGLAAFVCLADEYEQTIAEDVEDLVAFRVSIAAGEDERCAGSLPRIVGCYREYRDALGTPLTWKNALGEIQRIVRTYDRVRTILRNAHAIANAIPAYDAPSTAFKRGLVEFTATIRNVSVLDLLLERDTTGGKLDERGEAAFAAAMEWAEDIEERYPEIITLVAVTEAIPPIGFLALREVVNDDAVDAALQRAKTYRYARTEGCLSGEDPTMRMVEIISAL